MLPHISATAYLTPLREGGSLPGIVEADDDGTYVVKFSGAGQGVKALVAEIIVAELARRLQIRTPDLALIDIDAEIGRREPDEEVQQLITTSAGLNLAVDFLPGALGYDRAFGVPKDEAAKILWLDAFVANVDRSARNTNLLFWHRNLWIIDHGACLRFHHSWSPASSFATLPYDFGNHVLQGRGDPRSVHDQLSVLVTPALLDEITALVPDDWLKPDPQRPVPTAPQDPATARAAYRDYLLTRLAAADAWLP